MNATAPARSSGVRATPRRSPSDRRERAAPGRVRAAAGASGEPSPSRRGHYDAVATPNAATLEASGTRGRPGTVPAVQELTGAARNWARDAGGCPQGRSLAALFRTSSDNKAPLRDAAGPREPLREGAPRRLRRPEPPEPSASPALAAAPVAGLAGLSVGLPSVPGAPASLLLGAR